MTEEFDHQQEPLSDSVQLSQLLENFATNEPIFENELLYPTPRESEIAHFKKGNLTSATIEALITHVTSPEIIDYQLLVDLFLTFRNFIDPLPLMELLLCRLTWCLRTSSLENLTTENNNGIDNNKDSHVGKIALVRTFVCLRHWLLNHFQDDFISNNQIRQLFTDVINDICKKEEYTSSDLKNSLQVRVLVDLKKVYIKLCNIYWNTISLEKLENDGEINLLNFELSSHILMSTARISMIGLKQINDPSTRRSGILSIVDQRSSSATNLLLKEHAEMVVKDDQEFLQGMILRSKNIKSKNLNSKVYLNQQKNEFMNNNDKFILHPKASLNSLGVSNTNSNLKATLPRNGTLDNIFSNIFQEFKATPIQGVKRLSVDNKENSGFIMNGSLKVFKESKTTVISPTTPLKKMTIKLKNQDQNIPKMSTLKDVKKSNTLKKKSGFRSIFKSHEKEELEKSNHNFHEQQIKPVAQPTAEKEEIISTEGTIDLLSSRVIDELHTLSENQTYKKRLSTQLKRASRQSVLSTFINLKDVNESHEYDESPTRSRQRKNDSTMNSDELLNCFNNNTNVVSSTLNMQRHSRYSKNDNPKECTPEPFEMNRMSNATFKTPSVTMNWSNSLDLSKSNNNSFIDIAGDDSSVDKILSSDLEIQAEESNNHMISTEDVEKISLLSTDEESIENNMVDHLETSSNIDHDGIVDLQNNRFSIHVISRNSHVSSKSYMTYDSDFYAKSDELPCQQQEKPSDDNDFTGGQKLRKKNSFGDLRIDSIQKGENKAEDLLDAHNSENENDIEKEIDDDDESDGERYFDSASNIDVLILGSEGPDYVEQQSNSNQVDEFMSELPFFNSDISLNEQQDDEYSGNVIKRSNNISGRLLSEFDDSFSEDFEGHNQSEKEEQEQDPVGEDKDSDSTVSMIPSPSQSFMLPYPGFSSSAIAELAAMPDESYIDDPVNTALSKLKGKVPMKETVENNFKSSPEHHHQHHHAKVFYGLNDELEAGKGVEPFAKLEDDAAIESDGSKSGDEIKLESRVRDLFIHEQPGEAIDVETNATPHTIAALSKHPKIGALKAETNKSSKKARRFDIKSLSATPKRSLIFPSSKKSKPISLEDAIKNGKHIPLVLCYDSESLSEQLTLIERDSLIDVDWKTLLDLSWNKPTDPVNSWLGFLINNESCNSINLITSRFNIVTNWIISEILLCRDLKIRVLTISRFIHVANNCKILQNYASMFQIVLALTSERIKKLKITWSKVDPGDLLLLNSLRDLTKPDKNFSRFRNEMSSITASKGVIPFIGLHLSDLVMNAERADYTKPNGSSQVSTPISSPNTTADSISVSADSSSTEFKYMLINVDKFRVSASILKSILRAIDWSRLYEFKMNEELLSKLLYITSLTDDEMDYTVNNLTDP